jgi:hypothetical protein
MKQIKNGNINHIHIAQQISQLPYMKNKIIISISPGGYKGFYILGIASYIKDNYNTDNCIFSGASAGAWVSLLMTYKGNHKRLLDSIGIFSDQFKNKTLFTMEHYMKHMILLNCEKKDFDLSRLFIGVVQLDRWKLKTNIYSGFHSLEDALDCCISSSHIPFITGKMMNIYNNRYTFDGGFSRYPYLENSHFHIYPSIWTQSKEKEQIKEKEPIKIKTTHMFQELLHIDRYTTLFTKDKYNFEDLYVKGYNDAEKNKEQLDIIFYNSRIVE